MSAGFIIGTDFIIRPPPPPPPPPRLPRPLIRLGALRKPGNENNATAVGDVRAVQDFRPSRRRGKLVVAKAVRLVEQQNRPRPRQACRPGWMRWGGGGGGQNKINIEARLKCTGHQPNISNNHQPYINNINIIKQQEEQKIKSNQCNHKSRADIKIYTPPFFPPKKRQAVSRNIPAAMMSG